MEQDENLNLEGGPKQQSSLLRILNPLKSESICILVFDFFSIVSIELNYSIWILVLIQIIILYLTQNEGSARMAFRSLTLMMSRCKKGGKTCPK